LSIFTYGFITDRAIAAADKLKMLGVNVTLVEVHTLRPLDSAGIVDILCKSGKAITYEDHFINGGLGSAISEIIAEKAPARLVRLGLTEFPGSGTPDDLMRTYGLDTNDLIQAAIGLSQNI
jgi:transketolase